MVALFLPSCLDTHPREAEIIGHLVVRYGELEWALCRVIASLTGDFDAAVKAMYRVRGERSRLMIADALASSRLTAMGLADVFAQTYFAVDQCREIRNSYAHAHWFSVQEQKIGYYDLEKLAKEKGELDLGTMNKSVLSFSILDDQRRYFGEVLHNLIQIFYELDARSMGAHANAEFILPLRMPLRAQRIMAQRDA
jgi:hypothetical protein